MVLRPGFALLSATLVLAFLPAPAVADHQNSGVTSYTACLVGGGQIDSVAIGNNPLKPCGPNQVLIHLSGGDVTKVIAGTGLSGGGDNGAVTLMSTPRTACRLDAQAVRWQSRAGAPSGPAPTTTTPPSLTAPASM